MHNKDKPDSMEVAMELLDKANVVMSPGAAFGPEGEGYMRIALAEK